jgi:hypothetical protein
VTTSRSENHFAVNIAEPGATLRADRPLCANCF